MDIQARDGRSVCLATPTAAVPAWMSKKYPEVLKTGPDRLGRLHGNRVNMCWSSPVYRAYVVPGEPAPLETIAIGKWAWANQGMLALKWAELNERG